jgi:hypothetical protein
MRFTLFDIWIVSRKSSAWGLRIASIITWKNVSSLFSMSYSKKHGWEFDFLYLGFLKEVFGHGN